MVVTFLVLPSADAYLIFDNICCDSFHGSVPGKILSNSTIQPYIAMIVYIELCKLYVPCVK